MAVVIRMARHGAKKRPQYRVVVADSRFPKEGRYIETVGTYDPNIDPPVIKIKQDRVQYWREQGARITDTVKSICNKADQKKAE